MGQGLQKLLDAVGSFVYATTSRISELLAETSGLATSTGNVDFQRVVGCAIAYIKRQRFNSFSETLAVAVMCLVHQDI